MEITTQRLYLCPFKMEDITPVYLEALNDTSVIGMTEARHQSWNIESISAFIQVANSCSSILFGVFLKENLKPIGNIRLFGIHPVHKRAELSLLFYDKTQWGKGYGTEAVKAVVNFAFDELKLHRVIADYYAINTGSSKLFEKAGFTREGIFKDHFKMPDGTFVDSIRIAIINKN